MDTVAKQVPFLSLCNLCEAIAKKKGKEKQKPIQAFIDKWRQFHSQLHKDNPETTDSFYPALRLLLPQCERERAAYGIKETTLAKLYISIFGLDKNSPDAQKLLNYRSPKIAKVDVGDFASVAYFVLQKRCPEKGSFKINDINAHLDAISTSNAAKNKDQVKSSLMDVVMKTSALEQKWLIRMILKDMKMGVSENSVLNTYHIDAKDLYNVSNSLEKVCIQLKDPNVRLHEIEISLFTPFRPMLGEQVQPNQVEKRMKNEAFVIEEKYDGERVQLHKQGNQFKYFSRNGHEVTHIYGAAPAQGKLTPFIARTFKSDISNCILDGEMVIYSNKLNCIVSKGENQDMQALEPEGDYHPCYCVFDALLVNDRVLTNLPLSERVVHMNNIFVPVESKIRLTVQKNASTNEEVVSALNEAIDNREEGIVIKGVFSTYRPNARKGGGWLKVKPDYIDNLMDELDLLIIGGYFGEGRRANKISHFLLGVAAEALDASAADQKRGVFLSVAKVGSGYSAEELDELLAKLVPHWQEFNAKKPPPQIITGSGRKERPEVWIEPSKSHIVQVRAAEITRTDRFAMEYTLRFPRVQKIRYDKSWNECMTVEEFKNMQQQADGKLAHRYEMPANEEEPSPKKVRRTQPQHTLSVAPHFRPSNVSNVQQVTELFQGKEICVITSSPQKKQALERTVAEHGGKFVQNPGRGTSYVLADKITVKVNNIIHTDQYDVVKDSWFQSCIEKESLMEWQPDDMFHPSPSTLSMFRQRYDEYDDSYTIDTNGDILKKTFEKIPGDVWKSHCLTPKQMADLEFRYFSQSSLLGLFRICCVYMDDKKIVGDPLTEIPDHGLKLTAARLSLYGADIRKEIDSCVTHVIVHSGDTTRLEKIMGCAKSRKSGRFHVVTERWVSRCIRHKNLLQEKEFQPVL